MQREITNLELREMFTYTLNQVDYLEARIKRLEAQLNAHQSSYIAHKEGRVDEISISKKIR